MEFIGNVHGLCFDPRPKMAHGAIPLLHHVTPLSMRGVGASLVAYFLFLQHLSRKQTQGQSVIRGAYHPIHEKRRVIWLSAEDVFLDTGVNERLEMFDDPSFIVLTETKFSFRCIPVWDRYSPHRTRVEKKTCDNALTMTSPVHW
jgi:hypothetical protein